MIVGIARNLADKVHPESVAKRAATTARAAAVVSQPWGDLQDRGRCMTLAISEPGEIKKWNLLEKIADLVWKVSLNYSEEYLWSFTHQMLLGHLAIIPKRSHPIDLSLVLTAFSRRSIEL